MDYSIKFSTIKLALLFSCIFFLAFSFPLQVILLSPLPALMPYIILMGILSLDLLRSGKIISIEVKKRSTIKDLICIYLVLFLLNTSWQLILGYISLEDAISAAVNFILPVIFFFYFRYVALIKEYKYILYGVAFSGIIMGIYFVYDSFVMLVLKEVNSYSLAAIEYSQMRSPGEALNEARITPGYRSHGLGESHSVSAAWIVLSCLSMLGIFPYSNVKLRIIIICLFGVMLIIGLNFTSIIGFFFIISVIEYKLYSLINGKFFKKSFDLIKFPIAFILLILIVYLFIPNSILFPLIERVEWMIKIQISIASGLESIHSETTFFKGFLQSFLDLPEIMGYFPGVFIGMGFSNFSILNGDYGMVQTTTRLGVPFTIIIVFGIIGMVKSAIINLENIKIKDELNAKYITFACSALIYILFSEIHYSIWMAKSIFPILFICLAILDRYAIKKL